MKSSKKSAKSRKSLHRHWSGPLVEAPERAPSRAMLHAVGFERGDFEKSQIGIASTWSQVTPCNIHIDQLAIAAAEGVAKAGSKPLIFNTITISDGISMGTQGMKYSLVSREVIADSIETVMGCELFDGLVAIGGCDKNMPGCLIAIARLNRPAVFVYGGTILPGCFQKRDVDIVSVFEAVGAHAAGQDRRRRSRRARAVRHSRRRFVRRHVHGQHHGLRDRGARHEPAQQLGADRRFRPRRRTTRCSAGAAVHRLLELGIRPLDIMTKKAFENAITVVIALGGSTNAVLHLLAIAHAAGVKLALDDFTRIGKRVPVLADLKPSGKYVMAALVGIGGLHAADEDAARQGPAPRRLPDRDRPDRGGESARREALPEGPGHHPRLRQSDQADEPSRGLLRQPRAARRHRRKSPARRAKNSPARRACSIPRRQSLQGDPRPARSRRATWS